MSMRVGELARRTGVGVSTLRAWENRFGFLEPRRSPAGHRLYEEADVERVDAVVRLVAEGLTLAAAVARVASAGKGALPDGEAEALLYGQILEAADQGIWVSRDGRTRYVNRRMAEIMGYSVEELLGIPVLEFFDEDALPLVKERTTIVRAGQPLRFTTELRRADGSTFVADINTTPLVNAAGLYEGAVSLVSDVSLLSDPIERHRLERELRVRERQAETLALLGAQVLPPREGSDIPAGPILTEAVGAVRRLLAADRAFVLDLLPDADELRACAASPPVDEPIVVPSGSRSFAGYTALAGRVVVVDDATSDGRFDQGGARPGAPTASAIGAPIFGTGGLCGVLVAESATPSRFDAGDAHFIQGMANIIGTARLAERRPEAGDAEV